MAPPAPRRPAPGGGLAVLVVVTILAALAAPHATGGPRPASPAGCRPSPCPARPAPPPATRPPSGLSFTNAAGCRPAGDYRSPRLDRRVRQLLVGGRRPPSDPGVVPAHRPFLVRQGHPPGLQPRGVARRRPRPGRRPPGQPVQHRSPPAGPVDRPRSGRGAAERGRLTLELRGSALVHRRRPPGAPACRLRGPDPARWGPMIALGLVRALGLRGTVDPGLPAGPGGDRLRRRPGPGPARGAGPGGAGAQAGRRPARARAGPRSPTSPPAICGCTARPGPATASPGRCWRPSARSSPTTAASGCPGCARGATGPGRVGPCRSAVCPGSKAGNSWARYGHGRPHDPANAIPAAARYLVDHGARRNLDRAMFAYNHSRAYVAKVKQLARRYARGGGRR